MSGSLNKAQIIGNLGKDPEIRTTPQGKKVANFSMATNESYTDKSGNKVDKSEWHRVVIWDKLAEVVEKYVKKGSTIYIEGRLATRSWDDANGVKKYSTEIIASTMQLLGGKPDSQESSGSGSQQPPPEEDLGELPF